MDVRTAVRVVVVSDTEVGEMLKIGAPFSTNLRATRRLSANTRVLKGF